MAVPLKPIGIFIVLILSHGSALLAQTTDQDTLLHRIANEGRDTAASPWEQNGDLDQRLPWYRIDQAREYHLAGNTSQALELLDELIHDSIPLDPAFIAARRELHVYVLASSGAYEQAFDTLRLLQSEIQGSHARDMEQMRAELASRSAELESGRSEHAGEIHAMQLAQRSEFLTHAIIAASVAALLLITILILVLRPRKVVIREHTVPAPVTPAPTQQMSSPVIAAPGPDRLPAPERVVHGQPMDAHIMYDHATSISTLLNKGATVEAAGHISMLVRFLRTIADQMADGELPTQEALAFIRQYLKLETLRQGTKIRYTVDADRKLFDLAAQVPALALVKILSAILKMAASDRDLAVELVASPVGEGAQCTIKFVLAPDHDQEFQALERMRIPDLRIEQEPADDHVAVRLYWPDLQQA